MDQNWFYRGKCAYSFPERAGDYKSFCCSLEDWTMRCFLKYNGKIILS